MPSATPHCSVYIAASVDGFIAGADGDIEWLHRPEYAVSEMAGLSYERFIATVDALVMGRNSFEKVLTFPSWPYDDLPVIVLTSRPLPIPPSLQTKVRVMAGNPQQIVTQLHAEGLSHLYIDGGVTIQRFLTAGLINSLTITYIPILLGAGLPLFSATGQERPLRLLETAVSDNGFIQLRYSLE